MKRDVMEAQHGDELLFEGKERQRHRVTERCLWGPRPPYFKLACVDHEPCHVSRWPVSWWDLRWPETEPQARDDEPSVLILLKGREPGTLLASPPAADSEGTQR